MKDRIIMAATGAPSDEILNRDGIMSQLTSVGVVVVAAFGVIVLFALHKRNWLKVVGIAAGIIVGGLFMFNPEDLLRSGPRFAATFFNLGF